jgi:hypothetical protein
LREPAYTASAAGAALGRGALITNMVKGDIVEATGCSGCSARPESSSRCGRCRDLALCFVAGKGHGRPGLGSRRRGARGTPGLLDLPGGPEAAKLPAS